MQLSNCNIFINFNSFEKMSMNFFCEITTSIKRFKKRVQFATIAFYFVECISRFEFKISILIKKFKFALFKII